MRLSHPLSALAASLAVLTPTLATPAPAPPAPAAADSDPTDALTTFFHNCSDAGCEWVSTGGVAGNAVECTCNTQPPGWQDLAWFYTSDDFGGFLYKGFGFFNQCYKLPSFWYAYGGSMQVNTASTYSCHVYVTPDCTGEYADIRGDVQTFLGLYHNGVRSFLCLGKS